MNYYIQMINFIEEKNHKFNRFFLTEKDVL